MKQNGGHFKFRMILISGHFKTPSNRLSTLKNVILDSLIIKIGQLVQKILTYRFSRMASGGHFDCFSWVATMLQHVYPSFFASWGGPLNEF